MKPGSFAINLRTQKNKDRLFYRGVFVAVVAAISAIHSRTIKSCVRSLSQNNIIVEHPLVRFAILIIGNLFSHRFENCSSQFRALIASFFPQAKNCWAKNEDTATTKPTKTINLPSLYRFWLGEEWPQPQRCFSISRLRVSALLLEYFNRFAEVATQQWLLTPLVLAFIIVNF